MTGYLGLIEVVLTLAVVFGFGIWQLRSVSKSQAEDRAKKDADNARVAAASGTAASAERSD